MALGSSWTALAVCYHDCYDYSSKTVTAKEVQQRKKRDLDTSPLAQLNQRRRCQTKRAIAPALFSVRLRVLPLRPHSPSTHVPNLHRSLLLACVLHPPVSPPCAYSPQSPPLRLPLLALCVPLPGGFAPLLSPSTLPGSPGWPLADRNRHLHRLGCVFWKGVAVAADLPLRSVGNIHLHLRHHGHRPHPSARRRIRSSCLFFATYAEAYLHPCGKKNPL